MEQSQPALFLDGVTKVYRPGYRKDLEKFRGILDLSLTVVSGEVFGLLGPNGAGKTTTLKLIVNLIFPNRGAITVLGQPVGSIVTRHFLGYLPESPSFYRYLTGRELLDFFGRLSGLDKDERQTRVKRLLIDLNLLSMAERRIFEYSRGMRQRLGLAQALLTDPPLIILDEPNTGLDPLGIQEMRQIIVNLRQAGKTIFFSSHIISELEQLCDRVGILVEGRLCRIIPRSDWLNKSGQLEKLFLETVLEKPQ